MAGIDDIESAVKDLDINSVMGFDYMSVVQDDPPSLAQYLKEVAPSGSDSEVHIDTKTLEQAKEKFKYAKVNYLRKKIMYEEVQSIVLTSKKLSDPDAYRFPVARDVFVMKAAIKAKAKSGSQIQLLEDDDLPAMKVPSDELADLQKELSRRLQDKGAAIAQFYDSISIDKDPNAATHSKDDREYWSKKFLDMPVTVRALQKRLEDAKARLEMATAKRHLELTDYCWALQSKDALILSSIAELVNTNDYDEEDFAYLCTKLEAYMQKIGVFTMEVEAKTYSPTVVEAHKKIRQLIQKATEAAKTTKMVCRQRLDEYESASPEVKALIEKCLSLRRECKECEWQLMKVRESEKQLPPNESQ